MNHGCLEKSRKELMKDSPKGGILWDSQILSCSVAPLVFNSIPTTRYLHAFDNQLNFLKDAGNPIIHQNKTNRNRIYWHFLFTCD